MLSLAAPAVGAWLEEHELIAELLKESIAIHPWDLKGELQLSAAAIFCSSNLGGKLTFRNKVYVSLKMYPASFGKTLNCLHLLRLGESDLSSSAVTSGH